MNKFNRRITLVLLLLVVADLLYSFWQHYHGRMDGDMASIILPAPDDALVLKDPLGLHAIFHKEYYVGPNRFMPRWTMSIYFKSLPLLLQHLFTPLDSIYLAAAIAKTAMQAALLYLLSVYATGVTHIFNRTFLLAAVLIAPLFQTFGFDMHINIVDSSVTYSFFYGLAMAWLLLFFLPLFLDYVYRRRLPESPWTAMLMVLLAWIACFNGPLNPALMLLICGGMLAYVVLRKTLNAGEARSSSRIVIIALTSGLVFALWAYYVSRFEIQNSEQPLALTERYNRLPLGFQEYFTQTPLPMAVLGLVIVNLILLNVLKLQCARIINRLALCLLGFIRNYRNVLGKNQGLSQVGGKRTIAIPVACVSGSEILLSGIDPTE